MNDTINFSPTMGLCGKYKLQVMKNGKVVRETELFPNLITNLGMNNYASTTCSLLTQYCQIGTGNTPPAFTDTALAAYKSSSNGGGAAGTLAYVDSVNRYMVVPHTYTFTAPAAAGNISEVGVGSQSASGGLFSRALILDSEGNPTTITVLSDEDLIVTYMLYVKQPTQDFTGTLGATSYTIRIANADLVGWGDSNPPTWGWSTYVAGVIRTHSSAKSTYTGTIGAITSRPTGIIQSGNGIASVADTYTPGTFTRTSTTTFPTGGASATLQSFLFSIGPAVWQMEISPTIVKSSSQTLKLGANITWARDAGPPP